MGIGGIKGDIEESTELKREIYLPLSMRDRLILLQVIFLTLVVLATNAVIIQTLNTTDFVPNQTGTKKNNTVPLLVLLDDKLDSLDGWHTEGNVSIVDGRALLNLNGDLSDRATMDDVQAGRGFQWQYNSAEFAIRGSGNRESIKEGREGFRLWGFGDRLPGHPENGLFFVQFPEKSDESLLGFKIMVLVNNSIEHLVPMPDIDFGQWHNYTIIWEPRNATFLVNDEMIFTTEASPSVLMGIAVWTAPWTYTLPKGTDIFSMNGSIDIDYSWIMVDGLRLSVNERQASRNASQILGKASEMIIDAELKGLDTGKMWNDYAASKRDLEEDGYVMPQQLENMQKLATILPDYLDDLEHLFTDANNYIQSMPEGPRKRQGIALHSQAMDAWNDYDFHTAFTRLQSILKLPLT